MRSFARRTLGVVAALFLASCFGDSTGPRASRRAPLAFAPVFDSRALLVVDFERVRIHLVRPGSGEVVLDTVAVFPSDADSIALSLSVPVQGTSENFTLTLAMISAAGDTVFRAGPTLVTATLGVLAREPSEIPTVYVGTGANAASVRFTAQVPPAAFFGDTVVVLAEAFDSAGRAIAGTPVIYRIDARDTALARVPDPRAGRVVAKSVRGAARIIAELLTHQTDTTTLNVQPRPSAIAVRSGGGQTAAVGAVLAQPVVVRVTGPDGLAVQGVSVTFAATSGGGTFSPSSAATDVDGDASTTWTLGSLVGTQTMTASVGAVSSAPISATGTPAAASKLGFTVQPVTTTAGSAIPAVTVAAQDLFGNLYPSFTGSVTVTLGANPGGATLSGTTTATAVAGVATFSGLSLDKSGTGYTLVASTSGLTSATSAGFNITAGAATTLVLVSGGGQSAAPDSLLPLPIVVKVSDSLGNGVSGRTVTFAVGTGGGSVGTASATTDATGSASTTWTLGSTAGAQTLTVTATGLAGSPLTVSATASVGGTTEVTPHLDTLTALGGTFTLVAQARDGAGNPVAGTFTWVSRTPAVATVSAAGVVTAVTNGSTWVVATETNGSRDSALIVVEQRIATIQVTPGTRGIYLTGSYTFAATAVDGGGTPIPTQPTFTWSSTAPAVATVDAAGNVTALGIGATQIRATSGSIIGVANVSVITPITRIAVVVDTVGAFKTDTFALTSLGLTRRYRAIAHDTLDAVMTGIAFTWRSTNGSVAVLDSVTSVTAVATSAANGVTAIQATAQGFTSAPGAFLTVAQVLASIELTPATATIAPTGTVGLVARGKDANNRYISGGSFTFTSATPGVATVDATTGRVTGVALGTSDVTAASGAITSNVSVITVSNTVPPIISFGRDTLSVGRGSSASIPILLSVPPAAAALTVNLAVADTFAYWSTASVTIPAGQTSVNATLNGRNAGTTTVSATDGSGQGYAGASAVLAVTATMRLTSGSYSINTTDIVQTQVLLSDPSPAGGTYVTFSYGTPGIAAISPDPAFIPAGQLAADIQIRGLAAGSTSITPSAIGVNGTASSFTSYAPVLTLSTSAIRLGQGQYSPDVYIQAPTYTNLPIPVTIASSDTNVVTVTPSVTIPANSYYAYFTTSAKATGTATVAVSSPGWTSARTMTVTVTSPYLGLSGGGSLFTTSPAQNVYVYAEDSVGSAHYRTNSLAVRLSSRDTTVMRVLDTLVTIAPGQYYTSAGRVIPGGLGGSTYIVATASGHQSDSALYTVQGPQLSLSWTTNRVGAGQEDRDLYVSTPNNVTAPLVVTLANPDSSILGAPTTVTIPTGTYYAYFTVRGKTPGSVTLSATAPGYQSDNASYIVTTPRVTVSGGGNINNFAPSRTYTIYATDSVGTAHYRTEALALSMRSSDPTVLTTDTLATIPAGQYYTSTPTLTPVNVGSARIVVSAAGHRPDSTTYTIVQPKLNLSLSSYAIGRRQYRPATDFYVYTPDNRSSPLAVTLVQNHATVDSLSATSLTIPVGSYYAYFGFAGLTQGMDTVIASAAGYAPDTAYITVTTPRFTHSGMPGSTTTTNPPIGVYVYTADSLGTGHYALDTVVVRAVSSDTIILRPVQPFFRIPRGAYYAQTTVSVIGPGTANMTYSDSAGTGYLPTTTNSVTVTGPSLALSNGATMLGMRQHAGTTSSYVHVPNNVAAPLVVNLISTDTRVATVPASVTIPAGSYYAYFDVTAQDTVGTIQIQATATGYSAAAMNVQVTEPKFVISTATQLNTTSPKYSITIYATDANGNAHYTNENVVVSLLSLAPSVAIIDSTTVTIPAGAYYSGAATWSPNSVPTPGTARLEASDQRTAQYKYNTGTVDVAVITPTLHFSWASETLGIGQYIDNEYVYTPDNAAAPISVGLSHTGTARISTLVGGAPVASVTIPTGTYYTYFRVVGTSAGTDTLVGTVTSPAHNPATAYTVVGQGRIDPIGGWPASLAAGDSVQLTLYARDPAQNGRYVAAATTFTLAPNAFIEFRSGGTSSAVITSVTIPADAYYVYLWVKGVSAGAGSANITATDYQPYSNTVTITPAP